MAVKKICKRCIMIRWTMLYAGISAVMLLMLIRGLGHF
jgi:hypothetical protein